MRASIGSREVSMLRAGPCKNIVLVCEEGMSGALAGLPVAMAVKTFQPDCGVSCLVSADAAPLLQHHPAVDHILTESGFRALTRRFKRQEYDLALFGCPHLAGLLAAKAAGVPVRTVFLHGRVVKAIWHRLCLRLMDGTTRSEKTLNEMMARSMLRLLGLPSGLPGRPWVVLTPREARRAHRCLRKVSRPLVLVHPSCLADASGLLDSRWGLVMAGFGAPSGGEDVRAAWIKRGAVDFTDRLTLREWSGLLLEADVLVSSDGDSLALAEAMGVPSVRLAPSRGAGDFVSALPEAVAWRVEAVLRHRLRVVRQAHDVLPMKV
jgi:ADP-heptose:LPS heptosyltransferase